MLLSQEQRSKGRCPVFLFLCLLLIAAGAALPPAISLSILPRRGRKADPLSRAYLYLYISYLYRAPVVLSRLFGGGVGWAHSVADVYYGLSLSTICRTQLLSRLQASSSEIQPQDAEVSLAAARSPRLYLSRSSYPSTARDRASLHRHRTPAGLSDRSWLCFRICLRSSGIANGREQDLLRLMPVPMPPAIGRASILGRTSNPATRHHARIAPRLLRDHRSADENFVARSGMVREDRGRNAIIIQGTASERRSAVEAARSFDQDWLADQSVGIFHVTSSSAEAIMPELERVLDIGEGGRWQQHDPRPADCPQQFHPRGGEFARLAATGRDVGPAPGPARCVGIETCASTRPGTSTPKDWPRWSTTFSPMAWRPPRQRRPQQPIPAGSLSDDPEASARATAMGRNLDQRMGEGTGERARGRRNDQRFWTKRNIRKQFRRLG